MKGKFLFQLFPSCFEGSILPLWSYEIHFWLWFHCPWQSHLSSGASLVKCGVSTIHGHMGHHFTYLTGGHSSAKEILYCFSQLLIYFFLPTFSTSTSNGAWRALSEITSVLLSRDGSIKNVRQWKEGGQWRMLKWRTHSTPQILTSNELTGAGEGGLLQ